MDAGSAFLEILFAKLVAKDHDTVKFSGRPSGVMFDLTVRPRQEERVF